MNFNSSLPHTLQSSLQNVIVSNGYDGVDSLQFDTILVMGLDSGISDVTIDNTTHLNWSQNTTSNVRTIKIRKKSSQFMSCQSVLCVPCVLDCTGQRMFHDVFFARFDFLDAYDFGSKHQRLVRISCFLAVVFALTLAAVAFGLDFVDVPEELAHIDTHCLQPGD